MESRAIQKVLVANRGEIACRVFRTLQQLGIRSVAVYSEADRDALHVAMADEAVLVGPPPSAESYLAMDRIIDAARRTGADAIHPGYGFLSENPAFVRACQDAGIIFIGPDAPAIEAMGLKDAAKKLMHEAGVPVVPGYHGDNQDPAFLAREAETIGYPVLIKARAGGGGKGMRLVENASDFSDALDSARREAMASFGDDHVLIEKFVSSPRHIELQVFGDRHGNAVHLFERDCSLQRRHQKVIEEAPAPGMTAAMRQAMGDAAVRAAKAVNYVGAGTVEFIVDGSNGLHPDRFWFMEMNTRLQVEHPVTEAITGQDLVSWQIQVAEGKPLPVTQDQLEIDGHAFEARVYAEDTANGFLPATGTLERMDLGDLARVDTGVRQGDTITPWYDPMIAKVIAHGPDRRTALDRLRVALEYAFVAGTVTNLEFLARLSALPAFVAGDVETGLIGRETEALTVTTSPGPEILAAAAMLLSFPADTDPGDPWQSLPYWRSWNAAEIHVTLDGQMILLTVDGSDVNAQVGDWRGRLAMVANQGDSCRLRIDDREMDLRYHQGNGAITVSSKTGQWNLAIDDPAAAAEARVDSSDVILAPMPGLVTQVAVKAGDAVEEKQLLAVMEAMKMEHSLRAPRDGIVAEVNVGEGDQVESGAVLLALEPLS